jgi:hypothetical protein
LWLENSVAKITFEMLANLGGQVEDVHILALVAGDLVAQNGDQIL